MFSINSLSQAEHHNLSVLAWQLFWKFNTITNVWSVTEWDIQMFIKKAPTAETHLKEQDMDD